MPARVDDLMGGSMGGPMGGLLRDLTDQGPDARGSGRGGKTGSGKRSLTLDRSARRALRASGQRRGKPAPSRGGSGET